MKIFRDLQPGGVIQHVHYTVSNMCDIIHVNKHISSEKSFQNMQKHILEILFSSHMCIDT